MTTESFWLITKIPNWKGPSRPISEIAKNSWVLHPALLTLHQSAGWPEPLLFPFLCDTVHQNCRKQSRNFMPFADRHSQLNLTFTFLRANSANNLHWWYFSYFSQKTGFDISCKLSPLDWRQFAWNVNSVVFGGKIRKIFQTASCLLKFNPEC